MTDDLKARLCKMEGGDRYGSTVWYRNPDGPEAADRIEQLEAALRDVLPYVDTCNSWHCEAQKNGYAALGEKKDD